MMKKRIVFKIIKKIIISAIVLGVIYALSSQKTPENSLQAITSIVEGTPSSETLAVLEIASEMVVPYNYLNKQSLSSTRLTQLSGDMALPSQYGDVSITWVSDTERMTIDSELENFSVASPQGSVNILIYHARILSLPTILQGSKNFTLTAYFHYNDATLMKTYEGALVAVMPADFFGGVLFTIVRYSRLFFEGMITTLGLSLTGTIIGFILALILVFLRIQTPSFHDKKGISVLKKAGSSFAKGYITLFRGTPMIVQASFFWYGLGLFGNALLCGLFVVSLNTAAYIAEILRGSINAIDKGQTEASRSLGLSQVQTMRYVIFPQSVKNSMPAIGNEFVINVKDTAVLSVIGIFELFNQTTKVAGIHYRQLEAYLVVAAIYLVLTYTITKILQKVEKRFDLKTIDLPSSN